MLVSMRKRHATIFCLLLGEAAADVVVIVIAVAFVDAVS